MSLKSKSDCTSTKSIISSVSSKNILKIFIISLSLTFSIFMLESQNFNNANAVGSLDQTIQNFNNNLQSSIGKQIQSNLNQGAQQPSTNDNIIDCSGNDNFVTQSHTSNNGQTTTSTNNLSCNGPTSALSPFDMQR